MPPACLGEDDASIYYGSKQNNRLITKEETLHTASRAVEEGMTDLCQCQARGCCTKPCFPKTFLGARVVPPIPIVKLTILLQSDSAEVVVPVLCMPNIFSDEEGGEPNQGPPQV